MHRYAPSGFTLPPPSSLHVSGAIAILNQVFFFAFWRFFVFPFWAFCSVLFLACCLLLISVFVFFDFLEYEAPHDGPGPADYKACRKNINKDREARRSIFAGFGNRSCQQQAKTLRDSETSFRCQVFTST